MSRTIAEETGSLWQEIRDFSAEIKNKISGKMRVPTPENTPNIECPVGRVLLQCTVGEITADIYRENLPCTVPGTGLCIDFAEIDGVPAESCLLCFSPEKTPFVCRTYEKQEPFETSSVSLRGDTVIDVGEKRIQLTVCPAWAEILNKTQLPSLWLRISCAIRAGIRSNRATDLEPLETELVFLPEKETYTIGNNGDFDICLQSFFGAGDVYCTVLFDERSSSYVFLQPTGVFLQHFPGQEQASDAGSGKYSRLYATGRKKAKQTDVIAVGYDGNGKPENICFDIGKYYRFEAHIGMRPQYGILNREVQKR